MLNIVLLVSNVYILSYCECRWPKFNSNAPPKFQLYQRLFCQRFQIFMHVLAMASFFCVCSYVFQVRELFRFFCFRLPVPVQPPSPPIDYISAMIFVWR